MALEFLLKRVIGFALLVTGVVFVLVSDSHVVLRRVPDPYAPLRQHLLPSPSAIDIALDASWNNGVPREAFNKIQLRRLAACRTKGYCPPNQNKLVRIPAFVDNNVFLTIPPSDHTCVESVRGYSTRSNGRRERLVQLHRTSMTPLYSTPMTNGLF